MKNAILMAGVMLVCGQSQAAVRTLGWVETAQLLTWNVAENHFGGEVVAAEVSVDHESKVLELRVSSNICPRPKPGEVSCLAADDVHVVRLPIIEEKTVACGAKLYRALKDQRPVDGALNVIEVIDYSRQTCRHFIDLNRRTEVRFFTETSGMGGDVKAFESFFWGPALMGPLRILPEGSAH